MQAMLGNETLYQLSKDDSNKIEENKPQLEKVLYDTDESFVAPFEPKLESLIKETPPIEKNLNKTTPCLGFKRKATPI